MKKAKIMLLAIGVIAVVGGALAFKAKTTQKPFICYALDLNAGKCSFAAHASIVAPPIKDFDAIYTTEPVPFDVDPNVFCTTLDCPDGAKPFKVNF